MNPLIKSMWELLGASPILATTLLLQTAGRQLGVRLRDIDCCEQTDTATAYAVVPEGEDVDEYLFALEVALEERVGFKVQLKQYREATLTMTLAPLHAKDLALALGGSKGRFKAVPIKGSGYSGIVIDDVSLLEHPAGYSYYAVSGTHATQPKVPPALLATGAHAKGPRGRWGSSR